MQLLRAVESDDKIADQFFDQFEVSDLNEKGQKTFRRSFLLNAKEQYDQLSTTCFINCWHVSSFESAALWRLYANFDDGVAIRTTMHRLASALETDATVFAGSVRYHDFDQEFSNFGNALAPIFAKRHSFQHEKEVRLLLWGPTERGRSTVIGPKGVKIRCDLDLLIEEIVIGPYVPDWVAATIEKTVANLGWSGAIRRSNLLERSAVSKMDT